MRWLEDVRGGGQIHQDKNWTYLFRGSKPIDGICATPDIVVAHACVMPAGFGVGGHRLFVVDFQEASLVGTAPFCIKRFASRRLNT